MGSLGFFLLGGSYKNAPDWFQKLPSHAKVHLYSLSLIFEIWGQPHYRNGTFQEDDQKPAECCYSTNWYPTLKLLPQQAFVIGFCSCGIPNRCLDCSPARGPCDTFQGRR